MAKEDWNETSEDVWINDSETSEIIIINNIYSGLSDVRITSLKTESVTTRGFKDKRQARKFVDRWIRTHK